MNKTISKKLTEFKNYGIALSNDEKRGDILNWAGWNISAIREVPVSEITKENAILFLTVLLEKAKDLELISDYNTQHGNTPGVFNIYVGLEISGKRQDLGVVYFDLKTKPPIECFNLAIDILLKHFHLCDVNEKKIFTNNRISTKVIRQIYKAVRRARKKHPVFADDINHAYTVLSSEVGEIGTAILRETPKRVEEECYDAVAVLVRILEGDHIQKGTLLDHINSKKDKVDWKQHALDGETESIARKVIREQHIESDIQKEYDKYLYDNRYKKKVESFSDFCNKTHPIRGYEADKIIVDEASLLKYDSIKDYINAMKSAKMVNDSFNKIGRIDLENKTFKQVDITKYLKPNNLTKMINKATVKKFNISAISMSELSFWSAFTPPLGEVSRYMGFPIVFDESIQYGKFKFIFKE